MGRTALPGSLDLVWICTLLLVYLEIDDDVAAIYLQDLPAQTVRAIAYHF